MITISGTISKAWLAKAVGVAFDRDYYFDPERRCAIDALCNEYAAQQFPGMRLFYSESNLGQIDYWDKRQVQIGGIQPNMILGMLLGAEFIPRDGSDADITANCLLGKNVGDLPAPETLLDHELIKLFDRQIVRVWRDERGPLRPIPPFFWDISGRAAIHGVMTTAQKLLGETIFMDMMANAKRCLEMMRWIGEAYVVLCRHFSQRARLPMTEVHVGECSSCVVSPRLIERFVVPLTSRIGEELGPVRFHSCGPSTGYLEAFSKIKKLGSLDFGGETSLRRAREVFGGDMRITIAPMPRDLSAQSADPLLRWAEEVLEANDGGNLEYTYHLEPGYNLDNIRALTALVTKPTSTLHQHKKF